MEIENYLLHPEALERFVRQERDEEAAARMQTLAEANAPDVA